jgi:hypothetical protein
MRDLPDPREEYNLPFLTLEELFPELYSGTSLRPDDHWGDSGTLPWSAGPSWRWSERRLAKIWFVPEDVPEHEGNWEHLANRIDEIDEGFKELGFDVEIYQDGSSDELIEMLRGPADYRFIAAHGEMPTDDFFDDENGIRAIDRHVRWVEIEKSIGATGLLHMASCWSFNAICIDEDGDYPFHWGLADAGCSAAILSHGVGYSFPGEIKTGRGFEIERLLWLLERCLEVGLRRAMEDYREGYESMLGKTDASLLVDHDVVVGDPEWGISG